MESLLDILYLQEYHKIRKGKQTFHLFKKGVCMKNRLEELRKQRGIKQEDLATALEVSRQTIGSLENGRYNPSIILAFKIARYFQMSIEEIFIYEEESK
ncbi:XRE family transcriptional regulator [Clostridioides difficile]|nr:XRE family transcriptional regulator [Clostridioides difficile]VHV80445.1 XRE family transcriptional regulator [Clostridioides difficile]